MPPKPVLQKYVDVLLPIPSVPSVFTYLWEEEWDDSPCGLRVLVPFGKGKPLMGVVVKLHEKNPNADLKYRKVKRVVGDIRVSDCFIRLWEWVAQYYMCTLGEVYRAVETNIFPAEEVKNLSEKGKKGWIPSSRIGEDSEFYTSIQEALGGSPVALKIVRRIYERMVTEGGEQPYVPSSLRYWKEYFGTSSATIKKLRDLAVFEEAIIETKTPSSDNIALPIDYTSEVLRLSPVVDKGVTLLHTPLANIQESIPYQWLWEKVKVGGQVLLLLPHSDWIEELAVPLRKVWGEAFKPYTSEMSLAQRQAVLSEVSLGRPGIYCGHRSAVWLPFRHLIQVVVMDEESYNYKQYEPSPRYHAVRVALMLGKLVGAPSLLLSSSPSVESMLRVAHKDYAYLYVEKASQATAEEVYVDLSEAYSKNRVRARLLSFEMIEAIQRALSQNKRTLLYYHRAGYARQIVCDTCGYIFRCEACEIPLRYFESSHKLVCPTCGKVSEVQEVCPECKEGRMVNEGTGIERLEEEIKTLFPASSVGMESEENDKGKNYDILLSTAYTPRRKRMRGVSVVGVVRADILAMMPDYRAGERLYSFLMQCRILSDRLETMVVQYLSGHLDAIEAFRQKNYRLLYDKELEGRYLVKYPPFSRMFEVYVEGTELSLLYSLTKLIVTTLRQSNNSLSVYGPAPLPVRKKNATSGYKLTVFHPLGVPYAPLRHRVQEKIEECRKEYSTRIHIYYNVDP